MTAEEVPLTPAEFYRKKVELAAAPDAKGEDKE